MRSKILIFLTFIIIGLSVHYLIEDNGYVLIEFLTYSIEASLPIFLLLLIVIYLLVRLLSLIWSSPKYLKERLNQKREKKVNEKTHEAMTLMTKGNFIKAERKLRSISSEVSLPIDTYLTGFAAAHHMKDQALRSDWLVKSLDAYPNLECYIKLRDAQLLVESGQHDQAKNVLETILKIDPKNTSALRLIVLLYTEIPIHDSMIKYLQAILDHGNLNVKSTENLIFSLQKLLNELKDNQSLFEKTWLMIPKELKDYPDLLLYKYQSMMNNEQHELTEKELRKIIPKTWNADLIKIYGLLNSPDILTLSKRADLWAEKRPRDTNLWLLSSHLAKRDGLWSKAKQCMERSIEYLPTAAKYNELGLIFLELGQKEDAIEALHNAKDLI
tara:strand:+ start:1301 stop:2455 length:1155 start_codon:yes stop_codon:yes gene_type:complete